MANEFKERRSNNTDYDRVLQLPVSYCSSNTEREEQEEEETSTTIASNDEQTFVLVKTAKEISSFRNIEDILKKLKITIRPVKDTNALFVCSENHWKQRVNQYMEHTSLSSFIGPLTTTMKEKKTKKITTSDDSVEYILNDINHHIHSTLHNLHRFQAITCDQYEQLVYRDQSQPFQVNTLYFVPIIHHVSLVLYLFLN